jgi:hypothetical protein
VLIRNTSSFLDPILVRGPVDSLVHSKFDGDPFSASPFNSDVDTPADSTAITSLADHVSFTIKTRVGPEKILVPDGLDLLDSDTVGFDDPADILVDNLNFAVEVVTTAELGSDLVQVQTSDTNKLFLIIPLGTVVDTVTVYALSLDGLNINQIIPDNLIISPEQIEIDFTIAQKFKVVVTVVA